MRPHAPPRAEAMASLTGKALHRAGPSPGWNEGKRGGVMLKCRAFTFSSHACRFLLPSELKP